MTTRPGSLDPYFLELLPAVAAALRAHRLPGCTAAGQGIAAEVIETLARGDDPRSLFDMGKSHAVRDWTAEAVLKHYNEGMPMPDAIRRVAADTERTERTVTRHLRAYEQELWPGGITWRRESDTD